MEGKFEGVFDLHLECTRNAQEVSRDSGEVHSKFDSIISSLSARNKRFVFRLMTSDWFLGKLVKRSCCSSLSKLPFSSLSDFTFCRKLLFSVTSFSTRRSSWSMYSFFLRRDSCAEIYKLVLKLKDFLLNNLMSCSPYSWFFVESSSMTFLRPL